MIQRKEKDMKKREELKQSLVSQNSWIFHCKVFKR